MTDDEINELRAILRAQAEKDFSFGFLYRPDTDVVYGDYHNYSAVTSHEMKVFHFDQATLPRLVTAIMYYEEMCEIASVNFTEGRTHELIMKAKTIAPVQNFFGHEVEFHGNYFHVSWFMWFAKTFADVTMKEAYAFYQKFDVSCMHLMQFSDGSGA